MNVWLLAAAPSGEAAKSGPWGFAVILLLAVAFYFLFRSMSKHLRRVRDDFPGEAKADADARAAAPGRAAASRGKRTGS